MVLGDNVRAKTNKGNKRILTDHRIFRDIILKFKISGGC
jgi:hypothetical protein